MVAGAQAQRKLKPGFNLFSQDQDVQLGKESASQVEKEAAIVSDPQLSEYVQRIGGKLAATPEAAGFPYSFKIVSDKSINAFALPGGPTFLHTGLLAAADNEAQVAGVMAHEIAHVALRHGANQASKANLIQLPAALAATAAGKRGSLLGNRAQSGIGLGADSVLLKYSRDAERDADLLGRRIMARVAALPPPRARLHAPAVPALTPPSAFRELGSASYALSYADNSRFPQVRGQAGLSPHFGAPQPVPIFIFHRAACRPFGNLLYS